jgi:hypothetical protein
MLETIVLWGIAILCISTVIGLIIWAMRQARPRITRGRASSVGRQDEQDLRRDLLSKKPTKSQLKWRPRFAWGIYLTLQAIIGLSVLFLWKEIELFGGVWNTGMAILAAQVLFTSQTLKTVDSAEERVFMTLFGDPWCEVIRLYIVIPGVFEDNIRIRTRAKKAQFPRELEFIWRGEGIMPADSGMEYPYLIIFPGKENSKDIFEQKGTYGCTAYMIYVITDIWQFIFEVGTIMELEDRVKDVFGNVMQNAAAEKKTVLAVTEDWIGVNEALQRALESRVNNWGVSVQSAKFDPLDLGYHINKILKEYAQSLKAAEKLVVERVSEAEGNRQIGYAKADVDLAELEKLAKGLAELHDKGVDPETALKLLTVQSGLEHAEYSILSGSGSNAILDLIANVGATPGGRPVVQPQKGGAS